MVRSFRGKHHPRAVFRQVNNLQISNRFGVSIRIGACCPLRDRFNCDNLDFVLNSNGG